MDAKLQAAAGGGRPQAHAGGAAALYRRLQRLLLLLAFNVANTGTRILHKLASILPFLRGQLRRYLAKPLQRLASHAQAKARGLPPPVEPSITVMDGVAFDTADGVSLTCTVYLPVEPDHDSAAHHAKLEPHHSFPTILIRTPYGRHNLGPAWAQVFAERGYAVVLQDTRGRFGSGGDFFPVKHEINDGGETIEWIHKQPWCNGKLALFGVSYLGLTTYAAAGSKAGHRVDAIMPVLSSARTYSLLYHSGSGSFAMDLVLRWLWLAVKLLDSVSIYKFWIPGCQGELNTAFMDAPLTNQDEKLIGKRLDFLQDAIRATDVNDEFWHDKNVLCDLASPSRPATHIVGGWHDFFIRQAFQDFEHAQSAKTARPARLTVGRWRHWEVMAYANPSLKLAIEFFDEHLRGDGAAGDLEGSGRGAGDEPNVTVTVLGSSPTRWLGMQTWPPREAGQCLYELGTLRAGQPRQADGRYGYIYDPKDPTPAVGGPSFDPHNSGCVEQSALEARPDVLKFDSPIRAHSLYVCGDIFVDLHASSTNPHTDIFIKLCDVEAESSKSFNVVECITRLGPDDWDEVEREGGEEWYHVRRRIKVGPTACVFKSGHRFRLQISGGAHPLYMRNFGTGHPIAEAVETRSAEHRIADDTKLVLPVLTHDDIDALTVWHPAYPHHVLDHQHA